MTLASIFLFKTLYMDDLSTPYMAAIATQDSPLSRLLNISFTMLVVSFLTQRGLSAALNRPPFIAWSWLYERITHSKFSTRLFDLSKSLWFTSKPSPAPKKCEATSRCTVNDLPLQPLLKETKTYPALFMAGDSTRPFIEAVPNLCPTYLSRLLTRPSELTSYKPSNALIGNHSSDMFSPIKRMSYSTMRNMK